MTQIPIQSESDEPVIIPVQVIPPVPWEEYRADMANLTETLTTIACAFAEDDMMVQVMTNAMVTAMEGYIAMRWRYTQGIQCQ